jgi:tRNA(Ile)-lysidine synthase
LGVHPDRLREVVAAAGLVPAHDPGNDDAAYERVRWRQFQPQLDAMGLTIERLGALARRMETVTALVAEIEEATYPQIVEPVTATHYRIRHGRFAVLNPAVATDLLSKVLELVSGDRRPVPLGALESLQMRLATFEPMKTTTLHGCAISARNEIITVRREGARRTAGKPAGLAEAP